MDGASYSLEALARTLVYLPAVSFIGAVVYRARYPGFADAWLRRFTPLVSGALLLAVIFRAWLYAYRAFGSDAFTWETFHLAAFESRWGGRWQWQLYAALLAVVASGFVVARVRLGAWLAALAAIALCASLPLTGHAMAHGTRTLVLQAAHVAASGAWIGTLFLGVLTRARVEDDGEMFRRFAPVAIASATVLVVTGGATLWTVIAPAGFASLWSSSYGRVFSLKASLVVLVMGCGYYNWRYFRADASSRSSWVVRESALAVLVLAVTGWLGASASP